jgi:hypothetical protein
MAVRVRIANLDYKNKKTLAQCINRDISKEYFYQTPLLFKNIPEFVDAEMLEECWKYFKSTKTNLVQEPLKKETVDRISKGPTDPMVNFYLSYLEPFFKMFIQAVQFTEKEIQDRTSVVLRFTINRITSDELLICIIPGGKWWILNLPTDKNKMGDWFTDLMKDNHFGRCMMVSLYKVGHTKMLGANDPPIRVEENNSLRHPPYNPQVS